MSPPKEVRYTSQRISPQRERSRSRSRSNDRTRRSRSRSRDGVDAVNPGNNLYVTGLSTRVTNDDLEKYFNKEGKVTECQVVLDPRSRESRGFAFVTMETVEDAERCIKYLDRSVLEGRLITVERVLHLYLHRTQNIALNRVNLHLLDMSSASTSPTYHFKSAHFTEDSWHLVLYISSAKRRRGRTPTPGKYCGSRGSRDSERRRSRSRSPYRSRERGRSRDRHRRSYSPHKDTDRRRKERSTSAGSNGDRRSR